MMRRLILLLTSILAFTLPVSGVAFADSVSDYNSKVAAAQAKVSQAEATFTSVQAQLDALKSSSNGEAELLASAQTTATMAKDALDVANAAYLSLRDSYDLVVAEVDSAVDAVNAAATLVADAADAVDLAYVVYENAQNATDNAYAVMSQAQQAYDNSVVTTGGQASPGLTMRVYNNIHTRGNPPQRSDSAYTLCRTATVTQINDNWGGGSVAGCNSEYVMIHYTGYITSSLAKSIYFYAQADDGFYMTINGQNVINDWSLKGCSGNTAGLFTFEANKSYAIDAWFYEWTGGACASLYQQPAGSGQWSVVPASMFSTSPVAVITKDPALKAVLDAKTALYVAAVASEESLHDDYLDAESAYDSVVSSYDNANALLDIKNAALMSAETLLANSENVWQDKSDLYSDAETAYLARKQQFQVLFDQLKAKSLEVDNALIGLNTAKAELDAIPKPTSPSKVVKKPVLKPEPTVKPTPKGKFVPNPKR
jgi:hypothetical protein